MVVNDWEGVRWLWMAFTDSFIIKGQKRLAREGSWMGEAKSGHSSTII